MGKVANSSKFVSIGSVPDSRQISPGRIVTWEYALSDIIFC